jgi:Tol biopolymer transport system component
MVTRLELPEQNSHSFPFFLPDGHHFLYYVAGRSEARGVYVGSLDGSPSRRLLEADAAAVYASPSQLLFVRDGTLFSQAFEPSRFELSGRPNPVADHIATVGGVANVAAVSVSSDASMLAYRTGSAGRRRQLVWVDRSGKELTRIGDPDEHFPANPSLSLDGRHVAVSRIVDGNADIWSIDTGRGTLTRITVEPTAETYPIWSPDGSQIAYRSSGKDPNSASLILRWLVGPEKQLLAEHAGLPTDWSRDGRYLLYRVNDPKNANDIWVLPLTEGRQPFPVLQTRFDERDGQFSPDGKWIAYQSDESGRPEIYVQPFPGPGRKERVSTAGGTQVRWRPNGKELFYLDLDGRMMATSIDVRGSDDAVDVGVSVVLFLNRDLVGTVTGALRQQYAVSNDGQRFLMNRTVDEPIAGPIVVVVNHFGIK